MDTNGSSPPARTRRVGKSAGTGSATTAAPGAVSTGASRSAGPGTVPAPQPAAGPPSVAAGGAPLTAGSPARSHHVEEGTSIPEATLASLDLRRGGIGRLDAQDVSVVQGGIGLARADSVTVELGGIGAALAGELRASQAGIGMVVAGQAHLQQSVVRTLVAGDVVIERPSLIGFLLARRVSGDVRVLFDWRGALAFGAAFGLLAGLARRRR